MCICQAKVGGSNLLLEKARLLKRLPIACAFSLSKTSEILTLDGQLMTRGGPRMLPLPDGEVMLIGLENLGIFFSLLTQMPTQRNTIKWPSDLSQICKFTDRRKGEEVGSVSLSGSQVKKTFSGRELRLPSFFEGPVCPHLD